MEVPDPRPAEEHLPPLRFFGHFNELLQQWNKETNEKLSKMSIVYDPEPVIGPFGIQQATREPTPQEIAEFKANIAKLFGTETGPYEARKVPILWRIRWFLIDRRVSIARKIYRLLSGEEFPETERDWWLSCPRSSYRDTPSHSLLRSGSFWCTSSSMAQPGT